jgi:ABC-type multidrug transport system ATPase subunit
MLLEIKNLTKSFGEAWKLGPVNISLAGGEVCALLGKNGAGKTTLFQIITGNMDAGGGDVRLQGERLTPDTFKLKQKIGYLPQNPVLPRWASGEEILLYAAGLYEIPDRKVFVEALMNYWDCAFYRRKPLAALSHGMQKRVGLALASMHDPELLILDEPYSGLDLFHIRALDELIEKRRKAGRATLMSTHIAPYTAKLCDRVFIIESGQLSQLPGWEEQSFTARIDAIEARFFT